VHEFLQCVNQVVDTRPSRDKRDCPCAFQGILDVLRHFAVVRSSDGKVQGVRFIDAHGMGMCVLGAKSWLPLVAKDSDDDANVPVVLGGILQLEVVVVSKGGKDMGALQEGGVVEAEKVVGPNRVNGSVVLPVKHHVVLANLESSDLGMLLTVPVVAPHLVQDPDDEDGSVEDPGVGMRVPSDNIDEVDDSDKLMDFDANVPPGGQPMHAQWSQDGKEDGHFYHTKDIVDLEAHHFGLWVRILEA
jgi:hypothetical protein